MLRIFILTTAFTVTVIAQNGRSHSAASESQIRFAIENRYDNTGPGARGPEYAYNTYRTLEEALVSYVDDADTKLPEQERARLERFLNIDFSQPIRELPKTVEEYTGLVQPARQKRPFQPQIRQPLHPRPITQPQEVHQPQILRQPQPIVPQQEPIYQPIFKYKPERLFYQDPSSKYSFLDFRSSDLRQKLQGEKLESFGANGVQTVNIPLSQEAYSTDVGVNDGEYDHNPQYTYSYGVHDKKTGDSKSAHETRNGGSVKGYYTFVDPDGKQRTVHYTADDKFGFRATVQRTNMNTQ